MMDESSLLSRMKPKIFTTTEHRVSLKERFGVGDAVLSSCLCFRTNSSRARRMRAYAVNFMQCAVWMPEDRFLR